MVKETLENAAHLDMDKDEINDLCELIMMKIVKKVDPWTIIYTIIKYFMS